MDDTIKIRCPYCTSPLSVKRFSGIEAKSIACPVCKKTAPFAKFKPIQPIGNPTDAPNRNHHVGQWTPDDNTQSVGNTENKIIGSLYLLSNGMIFPLQKGRNIIGRMADTSKATIQIPTGDNRSMSREHLVIDVRYVQGRGYVHYVSLFKDQVTPTYIDQTQILPGEEIAINQGQSIVLDEITLRFELFENEDTQIPSK